jgi:DCC1-like thiol-disulfide oxidoreductase
MLTRPVLLYDGTCGFCRKWIDRLRRWDRVGRIDYVAYQQRAAVAGLPPITDDTLSGRASRGAGRQGEGGGAGHAAALGVSAGGAGQAVLLPPGCALGG